MKEVCYLDGDKAEEVGKRDRQEDSEGTRHLKEQWTHGELVEVSPQGWLIWRGVCFLLDTKKRSRPPHHLRPFGLASSECMHTYYQIH